jgi:hypothetical protein
MAKIGNEAKLILKLVNERVEKLRDSRVQTPDKSYISGYNRCFIDYQMTFGAVTRELEEIATTPFSEPNRRV